VAANYIGIENALVDAVISVDSVTPMGYPNRDLKDASKPASGLWIQLHNLRGDSSPVTLGDAGEDDHPGILQIDINYPLNKGTASILTKADEFIAFFTAGKAIFSGAQEVRIASCSLSAGRHVEGYYRLSVSVNYYARTTRI
jgi:hypothetical protein